MKLHEAAGVSGHDAMRKEKEGEFKQLPDISFYDFNQATSQVSTAAKDCGSGPSLHNTSRF